MEVPPYPLRRCLCRPGGAQRDELRTLQANGMTAAPGAPDVPARERRHQPARRHARPRDRHSTRSRHVDRARRLRHRVRPSRRDARRLRLAAGAIVSTTDDLANFYRAPCFAAGCSAPASCEPWKRPFPYRLIRTEADPGLGLFDARLPRGRVWGHDGTGFGSLANLRLPARMLVVAGTGWVTPGPPNPARASSQRL